MSYNHQNIDWWISPPGGSLISALVDPLVTTGILNFRPGYQPGMAVAIYGLVIVAPTVTVGIAQFKFRPTIGSATGEVVVGTLSFPVGQAIGTVVYKTVDNVKMTPGGELVVSITQVSTAGTVQFGVLVGPNWDNPGNNLKMTRSA
jgi:hypothetical protein